MTATAERDYEKEKVNGNGKGQRGRGQLGGVGAIPGTADGNGKRPNKIATKIRTHETG